MLKFRNAPGMKSRNIQYPETSISPRRRLYEPEARINQ
jgi:hypothetical protein